MSSSRVGLRAMVVLGAFGAGLLGLMSVTSPVYQRGGALPFLLAGLGGCTGAALLLLILRSSRAGLERAATILAVLSLAGIVVALFDPWEGTSNVSWVWMRMLVVIHGAAAIWTVVWACRHWFGGSATDDLVRRTVRAEPAAPVGGRRPRTQQLEAIALALGTLPSITALLWVASLLALAGDGNWLGSGLALAVGWVALRVLIAALVRAVPWLAISPGDGVSQEDWRRSSTAGVVSAAAVSLFLGSITVQAMDFDAGRVDLEVVDVWSLLVVVLEFARIMAALGLALAGARWWQTRTTRVLLRVPVKPEDVEAVWTPETPEYRGTAGQPR